MLTLFLSLLNDLLEMIVAPALDVVQVVAVEVSNGGGAQVPARLYILVDVVKGLAAVLLGDKLSIMPG